MTLSNAGLFVKKKSFSRQALDGLKQKSEVPFILSRIFYRSSSIYSVEMISTTLK
jgi:hypothetical protein